VSEFDAVLFDVDGTICEYDRPGSEILPTAFEEAGVEPFFTTAEYLDAYPEFVSEGEGVRSIREAVFTRFAKERGHDPSVGREIARIYARERDHADVSFLPEAAEVIREVTESHATGIVTNGSPAMQRTKLQSLGVDDLFDPVVFAGYDTAPKPAPEPFERALSTLRTPPERTLYVGNSLDSDVRGARSAGVPVAWLSNGVADPDPEPDYTLDSLGGLRRIVG
jgi:putative hydrolase of the HAD superfamily